MANEDLVTVRISREPAEQLRDMYSAAFGSGVNIRQTVERAITQEINRQQPERESANEDSLRSQQ